MNDAALAAEISRLRTRIRNVEGSGVGTRIAALLIDGSQLDRVTAAHQGLDHDAAEHLRELAEEHRQLQASKAPRWSRRQQGAELKEKRRTLQAAREAHDQHLLHRNRVLAEDRRAGLAPQRWTQILAAADDTETRGAELAAAQRADHAHDTRHTRDVHEVEQLQGQLRAAPA